MPERERKEGKAGLGSGLLPPLLHVHMTHPLPGQLVTSKRGRQVRTWP